MTLLVDPVTAWVIFLSASAVAAVLGWLEWQKVDRRRGWRLVATAAAVFTLALLGVRPAWRSASILGPTSAEALVWMGPMPSPMPNDIAEILKRVPANRRFALPSAGFSPGNQVAVIPDLAYLRRHFPEVKVFHLAGEGLLPSELEALHGCPVTFRPVVASLPAPAISFLSYPREIPLGAPLVVQGRVDGLPPGMPSTISLVAPDGAVAESSVKSEATLNSKKFELKSAPLTAVGKYIWKLRVAAAGAPGKTIAEEDLGVAIVDAPMPRVLVLESSPHPDTAALRRWMEHLGGTMASRTQVGVGRYQFASTHSAVEDFTVLDESRLAGFDLVLVDPAALAALTASESAVLTKSVATDGLGVLLIGVPPEPPLAGNGGAGLLVEKEAASFLSPWKLSPLESSGQDDAAAPRLVRPQWVGQGRVSDVSVPAEAADIFLPDEGWDRLVTDGQGHTLASRLRRGRGQVGLTLVRDTWRWMLENDQAAFANYWSLLFSKIAKPKGDTDAGRWSLADGNLGPQFVDEPMELSWIGDADPKQRAVIACDNDSQPKTDLALAQDANESHRWTGTFWPHVAGWHRVTHPDTGAAMDFFISGNTWEHLRVSRRRAATERFAALSKEHTQESTSDVQTRQIETTPISSGWIFACFLVSAGFLWAERYASSRTMGKTGGVHL